MTSARPRFVRAFDWVVFAISSVQFVSGGSAGWLLAALTLPWARFIVWTDEARRFDERERTGAVIAAMLALIEAET